LAALLTARGKYDCDVMRLCTRSAANAREEGVPDPPPQVLKDLVPDLSGLYAQYGMIEPCLQT
jgi:hypothetical protein